MEGGTTEGDGAARTAEEIQILVGVSAAEAVASPMLRCHHRIISATADNGGGGGFVVSIVSEAAIHIGLINQLIIIRWWCLKWITRCEQPLIGF